MPNVRVRKITKDGRMKYLDLLWTSIAELKTREEVKNFFKDLLSESEAIMLARRIKIAQHLLEGRSYDEIYKAMSASHCTIASVHRWLISGFGGYEAVIKRFEMAIKKRGVGFSSHKIVEPYSFAWLKRKYPLHFLLFNIFDKLKK